MMGAPGSVMGNATPATQISLEDARRAASRYLPGARVGDGDAFYGYAHLDVLRGIRQVGMVSVKRPHWPGLVPHVVRRISREA